MKEGKSSNIIKVCLFCGGEYVIERWQYNRRKFCSSKCYIANRRGRMNQALSEGSKRFFLNPENRKLVSNRAKQLWQNGAYKRKAYWAITEDEARKLFDEFKKAGISIAQFARESHHKRHWITTVFNRFFPDEYDLYTEGKCMSVMKLYCLGRRFEYRIRNFLRERGYFVLRSPRSQGPVDLVALKMGQILLIQCKTGGAMSNCQKEELINLAKSNGAIPLLAYKRKHGQELYLQDLDTKHIFLTNIIGTKEGT